MPKMPQFLIDAFLRVADPPGPDWKPITPVPVARREWWIVWVGGYRFKVSCTELSMTEITSEKVVKMLKELEVKEEDLRNGWHSWMVLGRDGRPDAALPAGEIHWSPSPERPPARG